MSYCEYSSGAAARGLAGTSAPSPAALCARVKDPGFIGAGLLFAFGVCASVARGQSCAAPHWTQIPTNAITARWGGGMDFDRMNARAVLFGGYANGNTNETLAFSGGAWQPLTASGPPTGRRGIGFTYDWSQGRFVTFGGYVGPTTEYPQETWELGGAFWTRLQGLSQPGARDGYGLAYDAARNRTVLFGGAGSNGLPLKDTWAFDGSTNSWTLLTSPASMFVRTQLSMAYDPVRQRIVMFGGFANNVRLGDTWEWDGTSWLDRTPQSGSPTPAGRRLHIMAYCAMRGTVVLFGGESINTATLMPFRTGDTWEWNGSAWSQVLAGGPLARTAAYACSDGTTGGVLLFGGISTVNGAAVDQSDTWTFSGPPLLFASPTNVSVCAGGAAMFSVRAAGTGPFTYQWQIEDSSAGTPMFINVTDGPVLLGGELVGTSAGATSPDWRIVLAGSANGSHSVRCNVSNSCGSAPSVAAMLTVDCQCERCPADFNQDGGVDGGDVAAFFESWENGACDGDVNHDGGVDGADVSRFFSAWEAGGC